MTVNSSNINCKYRTCAGNGCNKAGIKTLIIKYIKKKGYFCESCALELINLKLVDLNEDDILGRGM